MNACFNRWAYGNRMCANDIGQGPDASKFNLSRISAQHHRCNGKSIQCPSNVPVLMTITSLWALLCSVVLVPHNLGAFESLRNLVGNHVRFRAQMVQIDRKTQ